jgi:NAD(P)H-hydrate epimerase
MKSGGRLFPRIDAQAVPWVSVEQMREVDRIMVEELGISLVRMMENAGRGLVAARHLASAGARVAVALSAPAERFASVPAEQLAIARRLAIPILERIESLDEPDLVIDALLGYGQRGDPHGDAAGLIRWSAGRRVLALDVPSGLELASGQLRLPHVTAEATMTLAAPKRGLAAANAAEAIGRLFVADLSVPALVYERLGLAYETPFTRRPIVELRTAHIQG